MSDTMPYYGQSTEGWAYIGNDGLKIELTAETDVAAAVAELKRCCGQLCEINLYKGSPAE